MKPQEPPQIIATEYPGTAEVTEYANVPKIQHIVKRD